MKVYTPEISWHERDPIYTCAYHPTKKNKLATSGVTGCIRLWEIEEKIDATSKTEEQTTSGIGSNSNCKVNFVASLKRHCKSVNVIRWHPGGEVLASAGDEACVFLWKENEVKNQKTLDMDEDENKENWFSFKTFRGHLEDILDLSWSHDGNQIVSGSIDNSLILWDVNTGNKLAILKEPKGFVQGVVMDPLGTNYCCLSTDRALRIFSSTNNKCIHNISKIQVSKENVDPMPPAIRIFHDDTMKSFFRRMTYTSDGNLLLAPSGCLEVDGKQINTTYIFTRNAYNKPCLYIPHDRPSIAAACCPLKFELNTKQSKSAEKIDNLFKYVFAIATEDSVYFYDTQNLTPFSYVTGVHYSNLSDLSWSNDGQMLCIASIDGFCSFVIFGENQLGQRYIEPLVEKAEDAMETGNSQETATDSAAPKANKPDIKAKLQKQNQINFKSKKASDLKPDVASKSDDMLVVLDESSSEAVTQKKPETATKPGALTESEHNQASETEEVKPVEVTTLSFAPKSDKVAGSNGVKRLKLVPM